MKLSYLLATALVAGSVGCAAVGPEDGIRTQCVSNGSGGWMASTDTSITSCGPDQTVICQSNRPLPNNRVEGVCCGRMLTDDQARACVARALANQPATDAGTRD